MGKYFTGTLMAVFSQQYGDDCGSSHCKKKGKGKEKRHKRVGEIDCCQCDFVDTLCDKHAVYHRIKGINPLGQNDGTI